MKIIDWYILKRYLVTFGMMLLLFAPIGIVIDISEKINKILENKAPLDETVFFYLNFTVYFANFLFPIFLFLSIIWLTSKLANNTRSEEQTTGLQSRPHLVCRLLLEKKKT